MPTVIIAAPGKVEVWRGRTRVYSGIPSAALLAEFAKLVEAKADRTGTFTVRLPVYPTASYVKPPLGTIAGGGRIRP